MSLTFEYLILELAGRSIISYHLSPSKFFYTHLPGRVHRLGISPTKQVYGPFILGDCNVSLAEQEEPNSAAFLKLLETYGLMQLVLDPTHQSSRLLDHVITREASSVVLDKPRVLDLVSHHRLILFGIPKHQAPGKTTMVRFRKLNNISTQVILRELSDLVKLCQKTDGPNTCLEIANKAWTMTLDRMAPEKESLKRDQKRLPWFNAEALYKNSLRGRWKADISSPKLNRTRRHTNK